MSEPETELKASFAWTATSGYRLYPPYVNLSGNKLAVRAAEVDRKGTPCAGEYVAVELPSEALEELRIALTRPTPEIGEDELVERLRVAADETDELVQMVARMAEGKGVDLSNALSRPATVGQLRYEHSATIRQAADRLFLYRETLREARRVLYGQITIAPDRAHRNLGTTIDLIDTALSKSGG